MKSGEKTALTRRQFTGGTVAMMVWGGAAAMMAAGGNATGAESPQVARARKLLRDFPTVDLHSHPGKFYRRRGRFIGLTLADMKGGGVDSALFSIVSDLPVLRRQRGRGIYSYREFRPGEAWREFERQLRVLMSHVDEEGLRVARTPTDIVNAHRGGTHSAVIAVEGGDFLEGRIGRVKQAHQLEVRSIQLVHYKINELGDIQTEPPRHGGLTAFGKAVVGEMNHLGMIVDLAHLTLDGVRDAVKVTTRPVILSHSLIGNAHARMINTEHARLIAGTGGVIGAWDVGFGGISFPGYLRHIKRLVDAVGIDHVGIGTDMDGSYRPPMGSYRKWPELAAGLLANGSSPGDVAKVMGGNFLRVFRAVSNT